MLSWDELEYLESIGHLFNDLFLRGCRCTDPRCKFELADEWALYRLQSKTKLDQAFELWSQSTDLRVQSA